MPTATAILDLLLVSGGVECEPDDRVAARPAVYQRRQGSFSRPATDMLPDLRDSGSVAAAADFDRDGDLDLFIGSRCVPGRYPETPVSRLLENDKRQVSRCDRAHARRAAAKPGLVTSGLWSDVNGDGWIDLARHARLGTDEAVHQRAAAACATQPQSAGLANLLGWWNGIAGRDLDGDGDIDYVATNLGRNTSYRVSADRPAKLFYGDFAAQRKAAARSKPNTMSRAAWCPRATSRNSKKRCRWSKRRFHRFTNSRPPRSPKSSAKNRWPMRMELSANSADSVVLRNDGRGHFTVEPLPVLAQVSPGFGVVMTDFNADGFTDVYLVQNSFSPRREIGRWDGGISVLLAGQQNGQLVGRAVCRKRIGCAGRCQERRRHGPQRRRAGRMLSSA